MQQQHEVLEESRQPQAAAPGHLKGSEHDGREAHSRRQAAAGGTQRRSNPDRCSSRHS
jgi:hypothetical protein